MTLSLSMKQKKSFGMKLPTPEKNGVKLMVKKYAKEFQEQIRALRTNPRLYPLRNNILPDIRIKIFKGNRIVYVIRENRKMVAVLAVLSLYQKIDKNKLKRRQKKVRRTSAGH